MVLLTTLQDKILAGIIFVMFAVGIFILSVSIDNYKAARAAIEAAEKEAKAEEEKPLVYKVEFISPVVIGVLNDVKIKEYIIIKHPSKPGMFLRFDFNGIIDLQNNNHRASPDEVYFKSSGLVYKNSNIEMIKSNGSYINSETVEAVS